MKRIKSDEAITLLTLWERGSTPDEAGGNGKEDKELRRLSQGMR
jgi:hypothetical protein